MNFSHWDDQPSWRTEKFIVKTDKAGEYCFNLVAGNARAIRAVRATCRRPPA